MDNPQISRQRQQLLADARGDILEIGFGTGLNLPHYPQGTHRITAIDPNPGMQRLAAVRIKESMIQVDVHSLYGEQLPFEKNRFDCVVSTYTLCSIKEVDRALVEIFRVLKPGGKFLFLEHGISPEPGVQMWQHRMNRLQIWLADGCRLDRNIKQLVAAQPFSSVESNEFYLEKTPRTHGYLYRGTATK